MIKTFMLAGKKFKVTITSDKQTTRLGLCRSPINEIQVSKYWDGDEVPESSMEQTLYHEVTHAILNEIGRADLADDECLVQSVSTLFHQFVRSAK